MATEAAGATEWRLEFGLGPTVFQRYGRQQGALRGHNPRKHGRPSHHPLLAVLAEAPFVLHVWLRSGNCSSARGVVEFLKEGLALLEPAHRIRVVRADSGFFDEALVNKVVFDRWFIGFAQNEIETKH